MLAAKGAAVELISAGPPTAGTVLLLAHGAGAAMTSPFLETFVALLTERGIATLRFEFAYMAARRHGGKRRPPPRADLLCDEYRAVTASVLRSLKPRQRLVIGGKSMGGRVASLIADEQHAARHVAGLVVLGYPFHPPAKPEQLRTAHLLELACPALFVQGERDPFGSRAEVEAMTLSSRIALHWVGDGDHDLGPRGGSGYTRKGNLAAAADAVASFASANE